MDRVLTMIINRLQSGPKTFNYHNLPWQSLMTISPKQLNCLTARNATTRSSISILSKTSSWTSQYRIQLTTARIRSSTVSHPHSSIHRRSETVSCRYRTSEYIKSLEPRWRIVFIASAKPLRIPFSTIWKTEASMTPYMRSITINGPPK